MFVFYVLVFVFLATIIALSYLGWTHGRNILMGRTSIEVYINASERRRYAEVGAVYADPYDFGASENRRVFLGLNVPGRSFWRHVLWPSAHPPDGDGLIFPVVAPNRE